VCWKSSDSDVPAGSVGEFLRFKRHSDGSFRAQVRFPGGTFLFGVDSIEPAPPEGVPPASGGGGGDAGRGNGLRNAAGAVTKIKTVLGQERSTWPNAGWDDQDQFSSRVNPLALARATVSQSCVVAKRLSTSDSAALVAAFHRSDLRCDHGLSCRATQDRKAVVVFHYGS
jgi:hypothetical protein